MITKTIVTAESLDDLGKLEIYYREKYQELTDSEPSTTYTFFIDEDKLQIIIKTLTLAESVN